MKVLNFSGQLVETKTFDLLYFTVYITVHCSLPQTILLAGLNSNWGNNGVEKLMDLLTFSSRSTVCYTHN